MDAYAPTSSWGSPGTVSLILPEYILKVEESFKFEPNRGSILFFSLQTHPFRVHLITESQIWI